MTENCFETTARGRCNTFRVGHYDLKAQRSCDQAQDALGLSVREVELVILMGAGLTKREIASRMGVSGTTVETFRRRAYAKLGVNTGPAAVAIMTAFLAGCAVNMIAESRAA